MPSPSCNRLNHIERQLAPAIEHFVNAIAAADKGNEIARLQSTLLHVVSDRLHRVRQIEPVMLAFPCFDQRNQYIEPIALGRIAPGIHQSLNLLENAAIVAVGFDRRDIHG